MLTPPCGLCLASLHEFVVEQTGVSRVMDAAISGNLKTATFTRYPQFQPPEIIQDYSWQHVIFGTQHRAVVATLRQ